MNIDATSSNAPSSLLQKFLNGDVDLRSIEQRDLRVKLASLFFALNLEIFFLPASSNWTWNEI